MLPPWHPFSQSPPTFVLHVSVPLDWWLSKRMSEYANSVMVRMIGTVAAIPTTFSVQLADRLRKQARAGYSTQPQIERYLRSLYGFEFSIDALTSSLAWSDILPTALVRRISTYDAAYFELAHRLNLPFAATDAVLLRAAAAEGIPIYTP